MTIGNSIKELMGLLDTPEYCQEKENVLAYINRIKEANPITIDSILLQFKTNMAELKTRNPQIYKILKINEKRVAEIAYRIKYSSEIRID